MTQLPDGLEKLLPAKVLEKTYDDAVSKPAKELSKVAVDIAKTARLLLAPFQLTAAFQDRFEKVVRRIRSRVPEERCIQAPAEVVGPVLQQMQYLTEDNPLWQMFEELLTSSVDAAAMAKVHPSFVHLISQLCRDEAMILYRLRNNEFKVIDTLDLNHEQRRFENLRIEQSNIPAAELVQRDQVGLYYSHLHSLSLVEWLIQKQDPINASGGRQTGVRRFSAMRLTEFGRLFVSACVPADGFEGAFPRPEPVDG